MAVIVQVGSLRDLWKKVSDWVTGVSTDKPFVRVDGKVITNNSARITPAAGKITIAAAGAPFTFTEAKVCGSGFYLVADPKNTGDVYVYPKNDTSKKEDVVPLAAGDFIYWPVNDLMNLKFDASVNNQSVYWWGVD
jgi:hypothetical protein